MKPGQREKNGKRMSVDRIKTGVGRVRTGIGSVRTGVGRVRTGICGTAALHPLAAAVLLNAAVLLTALFFYRPYFEENDDAILAMLAEGVYGQRTPYLVYPNILFGRFIVSLYGITAKIRWYSVIQYFLLFFSMTALTWLFVRRSAGTGAGGPAIGASRGETDSAGSTGRGWFFGILFLLCFFYEAYVGFQYTKAAMLIAMAGYLLLFHGLAGIARGQEMERERETVRGQGAGRERGTVRAQDAERRRESVRERRFAAGAAALGGLLAFCGALLRISSFFLATAFSFGCGIYELFLMKKRGGVGPRRLAPYLAAFGVLFGAVFAAEALDGSAYEGDEGWKLFREFNEARTELTDYRYDMLQYDKYGELLQSVGVTENDAYSWLTWQIGDNETFTETKIRQILSLDIPRELGMKYVRDLGGNAAGLFTSANAFAAPLLLLALYILLFTGFRNKWVCFYSAFVLGASLLYYQYSGRWNHRVVAVAFTGAFLGILYYLGSQGERRGKKSMHCLRGERVFCLLTGGFVIAVNIFLLVQNRTSWTSWKDQIEPGVESLLEYTQSDRKSLFVTDAFADQHSYDYEVFRPMTEGCFENRVSAGGWLTNSPVFARILSRYGASNPYRAVLELPNAYFIDKNNIENKRVTLQEHYGDGAFVRAELARQIDGFQIYAMKKE